MVFRGGPNGKVVAPGNWWYTLLTKILIPNKKIAFGPEYQKFWVDIAHFVRRGPLEPNQTAIQSRCLGCFLICGYQTFCSLPPILGFLPKNVQIWPKIYIFGPVGPNIGLFSPFGAMPDQKHDTNEVPRCFFYMWVSKLLLPPKIIRMFVP